MSRFNERERERGRGRQRRAERRAGEGGDQFYTVHASRKEKAGRGEDKRRKDMKRTTAIRIQSVVWGCLQVRG